MDDRTGTLVIAGIAIMFAGLLFLTFALRSLQRLAHTASGDGAVLVKFGQRLCVGIAVIFFGLALVSAGTYIELHSVKHEVDEQSSKTAAGASLRR